MNQQKIGEFIKKIRKQNNLSQAEFAELFNVTYQAVSKWERGLSLPDISILRELSRKFDVNIDEILDGELKPNYSNKKRNSMRLIILLTLILSVSILLIFHNKRVKDSNLELKEIKTTCENFKVNGSAAYTNDKTTIIISNISYCDEDNIEYDNIVATLYEKDGNLENVLSKDVSGKNTTISNYIERIKFKVEHNSKSCKMFTSSNLYILISATKNNKTTTYKINLELDENCDYVELN